MSPLPQLPPTDHKPRPYDGPSKAEVIAMRQRYTNPAITMYYREPIMIVEGSMQYLYDETGRRYLDLIGGIVTVSCGHCHPYVTAAMRTQLETLQHTTTIYANPAFAKFAKALAERMPPGLDVTYFVNSGSEANDLAITLARLYTGNDDVIALQNCYHGGSPHTMGVTSHSTWKFPLPQGLDVHHAPHPDPYRSPFPGTPEEIAHTCAQEVEKTILYGTPGTVGAFIAEPIQGVGGTTYGAKNYLGEAYEIVRKYGGVCIADEVQTGFGRTGEHYWGFQNWDVVPDIVTMAKGIGNGAPLAAVTTRREIAEKLTQRTHFNTFGGNPVSMAAGLAVLETIDREKLQANCRETGGYFKAGLQKLAEKHELIGDVRGMGLMLGVELVTDRKTKEPAKALTAEVFEQCKNMGLLVGKGGLFANTLRIKPPMCINKADADFAVAVLDEALTIAEKGR